MKTKIILSVLLLAMGITCKPVKTIRGNGDIVTRQLTVSDYDRIAVSSQDIIYPNSKGFSFFQTNKSPVLSVNYSQQEGAPSLTLSIDENLVSYLKIEVADRTLTISAQKDARISPSHMEIITSSPNIKNVSLLGSMDIYLRGPVESDKLEFELTGSGDIHIPDQLEARSISASLRGSGDISLKHVSCNELYGRVAGSGDILFKGSADSGYYEVAGSGDISAYDCHVTDLKCLVKGSGDIRAYASGTLDAEVRGSGDISYKGNANVQSRIKGSGDINKR